MSLSEIEREHRRIAILRHLADCSEYTGNAAILQDVLNGLGIPSTRAQTLGELVWLADQGLLKTEDRGGFVLAELTREGLDVAKGRRVYPGIRRPSPEA